MLQRVEPLGPSPLGPIHPSPLPPLAGAVGQPGAFATQLLGARQQAHEGALASLLAEIDEAGDRLQRHPIRAELARYRALVGRFLKEATSKMASAERRTDRRNRVFVLVQVVDRKLEELTELLVEGQADALALLAKLQEIQGLLIDLKA